jgi:steroid delta-isomerase-like uncharacterized protein
MSVEQNKALVRRSVEEFYNRENVNVDVVDEIYAADFVSHDPAGFKAGGMEQLKQLMTSIYAAFPDFHLDIDELIAEGDKVVKRFTIHCTHQGEFMGVPPTGKAITFSGTDTYRIAGGEIAEEWADINWLGFMQQLGVVPLLGG